MRIICAIRSLLVTQRKFVNFLLLWIVCRSGGHAKVAEVGRGVHLLAWLRLVAYSHTTRAAHFCHVLLSLRRLTLRTRIVRQPARARFRARYIALKLI